MEARGIQAFRKGIGGLAGIINYTLTRTRDKPDP
jgi:hypothetical protein